MPLQSGLAYARFGTVSLKNKIKKQKERERRIEAAKKRETFYGILLVSLVVLVLGYGVWSWIGPSLTTTSGHEGQIVKHIHPKLVIRVNGQPVVGPANIGIGPQLWKDHTLDAIGMRGMSEMGMQGMSPLHTHDTSGTIHVESTVDRDFTLGQFFAVWGMPFSATCIMNYCTTGQKKLRMFVNGIENFEFDRLVLRDGQEIVIEYA